MIDTSMTDSSEFYEIYNISNYDKDILEQLGTKSKFWYINEKDESILFKSISSKNGERIGEDWAEKIACELAKLIGLPHANYELATYHGMRGVVTPNFISPKGEALTTGNELLQTLEQFDPELPNIQYIDDVYYVMQNMIIGKPLKFDSFPNIKTASEFFVGYLMFDTLISNQDRHNENWGRIVTPKGMTHLAPSYDHGASLARNESDETRLRRLQSKDQGLQIATYVR